MALLSTMVEGIAEVEGVEVAYASGVARYLREAGLLTQAGRGRGAAHMSTLDAARFLIGLNASITAKDAPQCVKHYERLKMIWPTNTEIVGICENGQSLLRAIIRLIEICSQETERKLLEKYDLEVRLQFNRPVPFAFIDVDRTVEDEFGVPDTRRIARGMYGHSMSLAKKGTPDKLETITISQRTLLVAAEVIAN